MYFVFILKVLTMISDQNVTIDHSKHLVNIMDEGGDMCEKMDFRIYCAMENRYSIPFYSFR